MKFPRLFFLLTLGLGLLTITSRVVASPVDSPATQGTTTPGAPATAISERMATLQALQNKGKPEYFVGTISTVDAKGFTLTLRDGSSVTVLPSPNTRTTALATDGRPRLVSSPRRYCNPYEQGHMCSSFGELIGGPAGDIDLCADIFGILQL